MVAEGAGSSVPWPVRLASGSCREDRGRDAGSGARWLLGSGDGAASAGKGQVCVAASRVRQARRAHSQPSRGHFSQAQRGWREPAQLCRDGPWSPKAGNTVRAPVWKRGAQKPPEGSQRCTRRTADRPEWFNTIERPVKTIREVTFSSRLWRREGRRNGRKQEGHGNHENRSRRSAERETTGQRDRVQERPPRGIWGTLCEPSGRQESEPPLCCQGSPSSGRGDRPCRGPSGLHCSQWPLCDGRRNSGSLPSPPLLPLHPCPASPLPLLSPLPSPPSPFC